MVWEQKKHALAVLAQPKPAMQQRCTSTGHQMRQRKTRTTFSLLKDRSLDVEKEWSDKPPLPGVRIKAESKERKYLPSAVRGYV